jgi:hypothetical protein
MSEKLTSDLSEVLGKTHIADFDKYCKENKESMNEDRGAFCVYVKELLNKKGITQQMAFLKADIPERYGYKLLSGEKHTRQRDVILRLCYAAEFTIDETQRALEKYEMPQLYPKIPRDAFLFIIFNERPGSIIDVNGILKEKGFEPLRTSGVQE